MRHTLKIGITVLVVAVLAMSGIALAETDDSADETVKQAAVTRIMERLQDLVDEGTISADQAAAVAETLADGLPRHGYRGHRGPGLIGIAEFLEMDAEDLRAALLEYDTLADLAEANGSSAEELVDFLVEQAEQRLTEAVENGRISAADAEEKLASLEERITDRVNAEIPEPSVRHRGHRGPGPEEGSAADAQDAGFST